MPALSLEFDPLLPLMGLLLLAFGIVLLSALALYRRARGGWLRLLTGLCLLAALMNPHVVRENQTSLSDVTIVMADRSASNRLSQRQSETDAAIAAIRKHLEDMGGEMRLIESDPNAGRTDLMAPLAAAMSDVPPDRLTGAILITDGRIDDHSSANTITATGRPVHALLTGNPDAVDRRIEVLRGPEYGIVDKPTTLSFRVRQDNLSSTAPMRLTIRQSGRPPLQRMVRPDEKVDVTVIPERRGELLVDVEVEAADGEESLVNNRALFSINAVRDRLRVLLVSGEPHPGERVWRDTLKSDPAVDLIHFTILRLPSSQDPTPVSELSLIPFPTERLFSEQIEDFDLVIFDRYSMRGVLDFRYFDNLLAYVEQGGAVFVANGPEFSGPLSLYQTPLAAILPSAPTGGVSVGGYVPTLTELGKRHPVTKGLSPRKGEHWGRWFRLVNNQARAGQVLLTGPASQPLLVLNRAGDGRVAELMSDHVWLWARGVEGGGPYQELLRRTVHWLMKEPDLEEDALIGRAKDGVIEIEQRSLNNSDSEVILTAPDGTSQTITLKAGEDSIARAKVPASQSGLYSLQSDEKDTVVGVGPVGGHELSHIIPTDRFVKPLTDGTGGGVFWLQDGLPAIRHPSARATATGSNWLGLPQRHATRTDSISQSPLFPAWGWALLLGGLIVLMWWRESR